MSRYTVEYDDVIDCEIAVERFERECAEQLRGLTRRDVGAVMQYIDSHGDEAAWFDYECMVGSIYADTGRRSWEV